MALRGGIPYEHENLAFEAENNLLVLWNLGEYPLEEFALDEEVP